MFHRFARFALFAFPCLGLLGLLVISRNAVHSPSSQSQDANASLVLTKPTSLRKADGAPAAITPADHSIANPSPAAPEWDIFASVQAPTIERLPVVGVERLPAENDIHDPSVGLVLDLPGQASDAHVSASLGNTKKSISSEDATLSQDIAEDVFASSVTNVVSGQQRDMVEFDAQVEHLPEAETDQFDFDHDNEAAESVQAYVWNTKSEVDADLTSTSVFEQTPQIVQTNAGAQPTIDHEITATMRAMTSDDAETASEDLFDLDAAIVSEGSQSAQTNETPELATSTAEETFAMDLPAVEDIAQETDDPFADAVAAAEVESSDDTEFSSVLSVQSEHEEVGSVDDWEQGSWEQDTQASAPQPEFDEPSVASKSPSWSPLDIRDVALDEEQTDMPSNTTQRAERIATPEGRRQAIRAVTLGFELVQRGAPYSARSRFVEALQIVSRWLDDANGVTMHRESLRRALAAYQEAADFFPKTSRPDMDVDLAFVAGGHSTSILQGADVEQMTASHCVREYLAFAEQEFGKALGDEELGSRALYGLGRLELAPATSTTDATQVRAYRAMALYQAALHVNPKNYAAANELGVLLTKYGKTEAAVAALQQSIAHAPHPTVWRNLAVLHRKLGQEDLAMQASQRASQATGSQRFMPYAVANPKIEWVVPEQFTRTPQTSNHLQVAQQPAAVTPSMEKQSPQTERSARRIWPFGWSQSK